MKLVSRLVRSLSIAKNVNPICDCPSGSNLATAVITKTEKRWKSTKSAISQPRFNDPSNDLVAMIVAETRVSTDHLTPEMRLRLITDQCALWQARDDDPRLAQLGGDPFWGFYWPGGQSLTRFTLGEEMRAKLDWHNSFTFGIVTLILISALKNLKWQRTKKD